MMRVTGRLGKTMPAHQAGPERETSRQEGTRRPWKHKKGKMTSKSRRTPLAWPGDLARRLSLPTVNPGVLQSTNPGPYFLSQRGEKKKKKR